MTLHQVLTTARSRLVEAGVPGPEAAVTVDLFALTILDWDRARLILEASAEAPAALEPRFSDWITRCARHEPASYIVGTREFWGLEFRVTPAVLIPRPETEFVVEEVLKAASNAGRGSNRTSPLRIADIGTGSGNIAVSVAHELPAAEVVATDVSDIAVAVARENAGRNGVADRIAFVVASYLDGVEGDFDIIASNPPYVRELDRPGIGATVRHEPEVALFGGDDGMLHIEGVLDTAVSRLRPGGWLIMEIGFGQEDAVAERVNARPPLRVETIHNDLQGIARTFVIQRG